MTMSSIRRFSKKGIYGILCNSELVANLRNGNKIKQDIIRRCREDHDIIVNLGLSKDDTIKFQENLYVTPDKIDPEILIPLFQDAIKEFKLYNKLSNKPIIWIVVSKGGMIFVLRVFNMVGLYRAFDRLLCKIFNEKQYKYFGKYLSRDEQRRIEEKNDSEDSNDNHNNSNTNNNSNVNTNNNSDMNNNSNDNNIIVIDDIVENDKYNGLKHESDYYLKLLNEQKLRCLLIPETVYPPQAIKIECGKEYYLPFGSYVECKEFNKRFENEHYNKLYLKIPLIFNTASVLNADGCQQLHMFTINAIPFLTTRGDIKFCSFRLDCNNDGSGLGPMNNCMASHMYRSAVGRRSSGHDNLGIKPHNFDVCIS